MRRAALWFCGGACFAQQYVVSTFAGGGPPATPAAGPTVPLGNPLGVAVDGSGNAYFTGSNCVFKLDINGVVTRIAGNTKGGYSGDGGLAANARLSIFGPTGSSINGLAVDSQGNVFVADTGNNAIRKISTSGIITTVAGGGASSPGDGGPAVAAQLQAPQGLALDGQGNLFIADWTAGGSIRKVASSGIITTVASAGLGQPEGIALDGEGNIYAAVPSGLVRKISPTGAITVFAGSGSVRLSTPTDVVVDGQGDVFISDLGNNVVRKVSPDGTITTVAGNQGQPHGYSGDGGPATAAQLFDPIAVAVDSSGNLFIADSSNGRIRVVSASGIMNTAAGNGTNIYYGDGGPATDAGLTTPWGVAVDGQGNVFVADAGANVVRRIATDGTITTVAGTGVRGYSGDGGPAANAQFNEPEGVAADNAGNVFIADTGNNALRKVSSSGTISTLATGYGQAVAADTQGDVFATDGIANILKISSAGVQTISQFPPVYPPLPTCGFLSNNGLPPLQGLAADSQGNLYIAYWGNGNVYQLSPNGSIKLIVCLGDPVSVAADAAGDVFALTGAVWEVTPTGATLIGGGTGFGGYSGDGGPATLAEFQAPRGIAVDASGNVYVADTINAVVRVLIPTNASVILSAVVDAASEIAQPISPGKVVTLYGGGMGPATLAPAQVANGLLSTQLAGTTVYFNGVAAPLIYTSATQVAAIVPYEITGTTAQVAVTYEGQMSKAVAVPVAASAPSLFSLNQTGAGQAAAINAADGSINNAAHPVKIGGYISLYATGEGQTTPAGVDGQVASGPVLPAPKLSVSATVGAIPAVVQYAGAAPGEVAGVMQVNVQIPPGVQPGGYVPVVLTVGSASTVAGAIWIAVAGN